MSILSQLKSGTINLGQAIAKVIPYISNVIGGAGGNQTPQPPAPADGSPGQIETVRAAITGAVHAYLIAKLGVGIPEQLAERAADVALNAVAGIVEGALHGAAAVEETASGG